MAPRIGIGRTRVENQRTGFRGLRLEAREIDQPVAALGFDLQREFAKARIIDWGLRAVWADAGIAAASGSNMSRVRINGRLLDG